MFEYYLINRVKNRKDQESDSQIIYYCIIKITQY